MAVAGLKFFRRNLFACLQEVTSSLRLFKVASSGLQMMKNFFHRQQDEGKKTCNCRKKEECPLDRECLVSEVVYQATVATQDAREIYIGLTANQFKERYRNQQTSFKHVKRRNETELSKHLWKLKDENKEFTVAWKIIAKAKPYTNLTKRCHLCNTKLQSFF